MPSLAPANKPAASETAFAANRARPRGFTLLELMLVLSILVILGSIAVPLLDTVFERQRLRAAAEEIRLIWDGARLKALRTGQGQLFSCELGTGRYSVQPLILHDDFNNVGEGATLLSGGMALQTSTSAVGMVTEAAADGGRTDGELEDGLVFASCLVAGDMRANVAAQLAGGSAAQSGQMVIFYPDGTTSTAELRVQNPRGETSGVQLRGLTGHSRVLDVAPEPPAGGGR